MNTMSFIYTASDYILGIRETIQEINKRGLCMLYNVGLEALPRRRFVTTEMTLKTGQVFVRLEMAIQATF